MYYGDIFLGQTINFKFTTRQSSGAPATLSGSPVVVAYIDNSTTEINGGITLTTNFDSVTGLNNVRVVATGANGYSAGTDVALVLSAGRVASVSVSGETVGCFSIQNRSALRPATSGRSLTIDTAGVASASAVGATDTMMNACADMLLNRQLSAVSDTNLRTPLNALRFLRNKWSVSGSTLTVKKEDDSTNAWTAAVTTDAAAIPIIGNDPS